MSHPHSGIRSKLSTVFVEARQNRFFPLFTVRCSDNPAFLSQAARDLGCLLDVDDEVVAWSCLPRQFDTIDGIWVPAFMVDYTNGTRAYLDVGDPPHGSWVTEAIACAGEVHRYISPDAIRSGYRLQNAKDLLRYGHIRTPLNDRVRLVAALAEAGSLTVAECFHLFREVQPMTGLAWLALNRFISIDLDEGPIGPETVVRTFQR